MTGALVMSWLVWNWRVVLVLLSSKPVEWKISYIELLIYDGGTNSSLHYVWGPLLTALFLLLFYPLPSIGVYKVWAYYQKFFIEIQQALHAGRLVSREELASWQRQAAQDYTDSENRLKRRDAQIESQQAELTAFASQVQQYVVRINELEKQIGELAPSVESVSNLQKYLLNNQFVLVFNPELPSRNSKPMLFGPNGTILEGQNKNENTWRIKSEFLELLNSKGDVHNRFYFHTGKQEFVGTGDAALPAIRGQRLYAVT